MARHQVDPQHLTQRAYEGADRKPSAFDCPAGRLAKVSGRDRVRAARAVIRLGRDDGDRAQLLEAVGLDWQLASPVAATRQPGKRRRERAPQVDPRECSRCGETKPASEFYPGRTKCKTCHQKANSAAQARRRKARLTELGGEQRKGGRQRLPRVPVARKRCSRCRDVKPAGEFSADKRTPSGLHSQCKECCNARRRTAEAA